MKATNKPVLTAAEALAKRKKGFLVVRSDKNPEWKYRSQLRLALRDTDRAKDAWGVSIKVVDCAAKKTVYEFHSLGS